MGSILEKRLRMRGVRSAGQEVGLNLLVAAGHLRERVERVCGEHDLSMGQYNVLRILRGEPDGYARGEIAERLVDRAPDVTRLIDRLEGRGLVERERSAEDRRRSVTRITDKGLKLIERMQPALDAVDRDLERRLSAPDRRELSRLLERLYDTD